MTILIAEDDPISRKVLRLTLQQLGYEVLIADDGAEAWELFDKDPVRIIVSDWMMPGLDGLELCRRVRDRPQTPYTYIIMLTAAHTTSDDYSLAMQSGIDDFLTKPLNREMLRTRLHVAERILLYATGGLAYGEVSATAPVIPLSWGSTRAGWTVGAGAEAAIDHNWSIKLEYLYMDLGNVGSNTTTGANVVTQLGVPIRFNTVTTTTLTSAFNTRFTDNILRVGVNYRFGGPVVAKY